MTTVSNHATTIKFDAATQERVKRLADARHRPPQVLILEAIRQYVEREEKREAFRQDGIRAWNEYQATGLHVTQEDADAWLARLEARYQEETGSSFPESWVAPSAVDN